MGTRHLLDTNAAVIYYLAGFLNPAVQNKIENLIHPGAAVSIVTKIELLSWSRLSTDEIVILENFLNDALTINLTDEVINTTIFIRRSYKKVKLTDAIIAATSLSLNMPLITVNETNFKIISGIKIINPFETND